MEMRIIKSINEMQRMSLKMKREGKSIGFVPTMGFLHEGHLRLVDYAKRYADVVVVSIFVNPTQFGPKEDLNRYPRDIEGDCKKLKSRGADIVFIPHTNDVYPEDFQTYVEVFELEKPLCGRFRPGHFRGVATIVAKLFNIVMPDYAIFGKKDYQQFLLIKQMVRDLNFPVKIIGVETVREEDMLAMSSRNSYLSKEEREVARHFAESLYLAQRVYNEGGFKRPVDVVRYVERYLSKFKGIKVQYVELLDALRLKEVRDFSQDMVLASAVFVGSTRLIDNRVLHKRCR